MHGLVTSLYFIIKTIGVYKRNYSFRMNIMEETFENRSCVEILANDIKIYTIYQCMFYSVLQYTYWDLLRGITF